MSSKSLRVFWCERSAAIYAVENWHYSKAMPPGKTSQIGVWENGNFIGAVVFGYGVNRNRAKFLGLSEYQVVELCRVALTKHTAHVTRIISISLNLFKKKYPRIKAVVSFADPEQGHTGAIYKAGNWSYVGKTNPEPVYYVDGLRLHKRVVTSKGSRWNKQVLRKIIVKPKLRFVMVLDKNDKTLVAKVKMITKKPEQCAESRDNAAADFQSAEDGANPISALHNS